MQKKIVKEARDFAIKRHGDQLYGKVPYVSHLDQVAKLVSNYEYEAQVIAYLHDVLEDTDTTISELVEYFGVFVTKCVNLISDQKEGSRTAKKYAANSLFFRFNKHYCVALIVKVADRLANVRKGSKNDMYRREHQAFRIAAYRPGLCDWMWKEIEEILDDKG